MKENSVLAYFVVAIYMICIAISSCRRADEDIKPVTQTPNTTTGENVGTDNPTNTLTGTNNTTSGTNTNTFSGVNTNTGENINSIPGVNSTVSPVNTSSGTNSPTTPAVGTYTIRYLNSNEINQPLPPQNTVISPIVTTPSVVTPPPVVTVPSPPVTTTPGVSKISFSASIRAIMVSNNCNSCHSYGNYNNARNNADEIYNRLSKPQGDPQLMPRGGNRLSNADIALFKQWIDDGLEP